MSPVKVKDFADRLGVSQGYVYKHVKLGNLPTVSLPGGAIRIDWDAFTSQKGPTTEARSLKTEKHVRSVSRKSKGEDLWQD
jgi:predicted site-specific integrase-resolvase